MASPRDRPLWCWTVALCLTAGAGLVHAQAPRQDAGEDGSQRKPPCESLPEPERRRTEACKTDEERREDAYQKRLKQIAEREKPTHTSFLRWMHLDALWVPTAFGGPTSYGLIGTHITVGDIKGTHVFGPPGVMLVLDDNGVERIIRPALTWGVSVHIIDFRTPGTNRDTQLYLNLTKVWTVGGYRNSLDMVGMSFTWKK